MLRPLMLAVLLLCPTALPAQFKPADPKHPRTLPVPSSLPPAETITQLTTVLIAREYTIDRADGTAVIRVFERPLELAALLEGSVVQALAQRRRLV